MTNIEFDVGCNVDIERGIARYGVYSDSASLTIAAPQKFLESSDPSLRISLSATDEDHDDAWAHAMTGLTPEEAKELGEFLLDHYDDEPTVLMDHE